MAPLPGNSIAITVLALTVAESAVHILEANDIQDRARSWNTADAPHVHGLEPAVGLVEMAQAAIWSKSMQPSADAWDHWSDDTLEETWWWAPR